MAIVAAIKKGADVIVTPCSLCQYNLTTGQKSLFEKNFNFL
ncbi:MAG: hypothetical protein RBS85_03900 [Methanofastidiosum sp.]|jgi:heterodisulfide reductase subunit B|nr:hypothetical protein [Methanofastidiosum sp.]